MERLKLKEWLDCNGWEDLTDKEGFCYYKENTVLDILEKALKQTLPMCSEEVVCNNLISYYDCRHWQKQEFGCDGCTKMYSQTEC